VLLSSHLLEEVERVCDHLLFFDHGRVLLSEPMDAVLENHYQISLRSQARVPWESLPGVLQAVEDGGEWQLFCFADIGKLTVLLERQGAQILEKRRLSLNETFLARSRQRHVLNEVA
jgi:ABC-type multidrug transport system ATPase subunit